MLSSLISFLAPAAAPATAVETSPPAVASSAAGRPRARAESVRFALAVIGNAFGFAVLFGGCWLSLIVLRAFL
jgi:hypothetical protein